MIIKSDQILVAATKKELQDFLIDCNNYELLLPNDKISNFNSTVSQCSFKVQGAITITLIQNSIDSSGNILLRSGEDGPFTFVLKINLQEENSKTSGNIEFNGELTAFLAMVAAKPLQNLFNFMAEKIIQRFTLEN